VGGEGPQMYRPNNNSSLTKTPRVAIVAIQMRMIVVVEDLLLSKVPRRTITSHPLTIMNIKSMMTRKNYVRQSQATIILTIPLVNSMKTALLSHLIIA